MSKVLYFLVFMAVIAQIYTVPSPAVDVDAAAKGVEDQVKQGEDKAGKIAGSAGGIPKSAIGSAGGMLAPLVKLPETVFDDGAKLMNSFAGMLVGGI